MLTATRIRSAIESGQFVVAPFDPALVNPASLDVRLGARLRVYEPRPLDRGAVLLDVAREPRSFEFGVGPEGLVLDPGRVYLGTTVEYFEFRALYGQLAGKSSIGRLGLAPHYCAGFIDPGFRGHITLELVCVHPIRVYPGMRVAQICLGVPDGPVTPYTGRYQDQEGPTASRAHLDYPPG